MICPNCGTNIKKEWKVCPKCGNRLNAEKVEPIYEKNNNRKKKYRIFSKIVGGCLVLGIAFSVLMMLPDNGNNTTNQVSKTADSELSNKSETSSTNRSTEVPIYSLEYLYDYIEHHKIKIDIDREQRMINKLLTNNEEPVYLKKTGNPACYSRTNETTEFLYVGDLKDNRPHGKGKIYTVASAHEVGSYTDLSVSISSFNWYGDGEDAVYLAVYVGEFEKGYYDGFGWEYILPASVADNDDWYTTDFIEDYYVPVTDDIIQNILISCNPVGYMGDFRKGEHHGNGIEIIYANMVLQSSLISEVLYQDQGILIDEELILFDGEYKKGKRDGEAKEYYYGHLAFDGELDKGEREGEGKEWYIGTDQLKYDGNWKNDEYHGKGTLYDENGDVIYKGKWEFGDYAS